VSKERYNSNEDARGKKKQPSQGVRRPSHTSSN